MEAQLDQVLENARILSSKVHNVGTGRHDVRELRREVLGLLYFADVSLSQGGREPEWQGDLGARRNVSFNMRHIRFAKLARTAGALGPGGSFKTLQESEILRFMLESARNHFLLR